MRNRNITEYQKPWTENGIPEGLKFDAAKKRNLSANEANENMTKNSRNNTEKSYSTTENGMPEGLKFDAFLPPSQNLPANSPHTDIPECSKSDSSVQNTQNPPTKGCSFHTDEEDDDVVQQTPDIQISNNENDFGNETTCSEELHQQKSSLENMKKFHKSLKFQIYQCGVCHEAWPLKTKGKNTVSYTCSCCVRNKNIPKKFSTENSMIPSPVPKELQGLTQFEEMLIARAFPVMRVYTKPRGGQRAYKGHVITLPQDVQQLADILPRCPKDLPVIIFTINGKDNSSSDFVVRHKKVEDALNWLTGENENGEPNNPLYKNVKIERQTLANLPEHGVLSDVTRVECGDSTIENEDVGIDTGPVNFEDDEKVYNSQTEMGSFVPTNIDTKREEEKISEEFLNAPQQYNWNIGDEPLNEFDCQFLASMAFPTLFPDGKGDLTNSAVLSDTSNNSTQSFAAKLKHLIKFSEKNRWKMVL